ncbi:MAG TPA: M28 family peptidase, partial [Thermoanaerobaculia bacterium]|nr:M28 family peptidase [Thermoanaerobaculia bacterium]
MKPIVLWLLLAILLTTLIFRETRGPEPKAAGAPGREFSAGRAQPLLQAVIGDLPHPVGSAEHERVRDRIVARFRELGYDVIVQRRFACNPHAECATVQNVIARWPADNVARKAVVLSAHYDSVPSGPGVSDDGMGVAVLLEVARAMRGERTLNPVIFLADDAEELGLIGAEAYVAEPGLVGRTGAIVNVENRGTSGTSYLFETSRNNRWLISTVARALRRPVTTSLFVSIYELLPNDTDLTVFKRVGLEGVNFAAIGNVHAYHTPLDDQRHADPRLLQHHGDNALAAARALANADLAQRSGGNAVHFDVLGLFVIAWPEGITMWMALLGLVISIVGAGRAEARPAFVGLAWFVVAVIVAGGAGLAATVLLRLPVWIAHPDGAVAAMWLLGIAAAIAVAPRRLALPATAIAWNALAIILTLALRGGSYLFVVPGLVLAAATLMKDQEWGAIAATVVAAVLWFPFGLVLYDALGTPALAGIAVMLALVFTPVASLHDRRVATAPAILAVILLIWTALQPVYTPEKPRRINYTYFDFGGQTFWASALPLPGATQRVVTPWYAGAPKLWVKPAPAASLPPVEIVVLSDQLEAGKRKVTVEVLSVRGAERVALLWKTRATVDRITVNGVTPPEPGGRF